MSAGELAEEDRLRPPFRYLDLATWSRAMEALGLVSAVVLVAGWLVAMMCAPGKVLDPRTLLLLNTLSAFLCPLWVCQDPTLDDPRPFVLGLSRRVAALCVLLSAYLALAAGHLWKLQPASVRI